jgi:hypothetical protein
MTTNISINQAINAIKEDYTWGNSLAIVSLGNGGAGCDLLTGDTLAGFIDELVADLESGRAKYIAPADVDPADDWADLDNPNQDTIAAFAYPDGYTVQVLINPSYL